MPCSKAQLASFFSLLGICLTIVIRNRICRAGDPSVSLNGMYLENRVRKRSFKKQELRGAFEMRTRLIREEKQKAF